MTQLLAKSVDGRVVQPLQILLIDDDPHLLASFAAVYRKQPVELYLAVSGFDGLRILQERPIDVVIVDGYMPRLSGLKTLKIIRRRYPKILRVLLTGAPDPVAREGDDAGLHYRFTKPCDPIELLDSVRWASRVEIPLCI